MGPAPLCFLAGRIGRGANHQRGALGQVPPQKRQRDAVEEEVPDAGLLRELALEEERPARREFGGIRKLDENEAGGAAFEIRHERVDERASDAEALRVVRDRHPVHLACPDGACHFAVDRHSSETIPRDRDETGRFRIAASGSGGAERGP
jgi:hypothetical protein